MYISAIEIQLTLQGQNDSKDSLDKITNVCDDSQ